MKTFTQKINDLKNRGRYRSLQLPHGIDLTSNDYLGLRNHPALRRAAIKALEDGIEIGAGGSRLLCGHTAHHAALEEFAASYFGCGGALYFATGFQANMALFTTLPQRGDTILFDELIHASARDGIQAGYAAHIRIRHNDLDAFEAALKTAKGQRWIAVESLYSMDGDFAPVQELQALADKYDAILIVDEAHATGVCGASGRGVSEGLKTDNLITLHTCGKALGVAGGLICAPAEMIAYMINAARPFIYSTAPMPLQALLVMEALKIVRSEEGQARRARLQNLCARAQTALGGPGSHIVPIILGTDRAAMDAAHALQKAGVDIRAIRPPTVAEGTARLRLSLSADLTDEVFDRFMAALTPLLRKDAA